MRKRIREIVADVIANEFAENYYVIVEACINGADRYGVANSIADKVIHELDVYINEDMKKG